MEKLIDGLITIVMLSIVLGCYPQLRSFAISEAKQAMKVGKPTPAFFPSGYDVMRNVKRY